MNKLVLLRHGQSQWNLENKFTGWVDVDLSENGLKEAQKAGSLLSNITFDKVFTSKLKRAIKTSEIALEQSKSNDHLKDGNGFIRTEAQALNERDYGDLAGLNKAETVEKYGKDQVYLWRRGFDIQPPNGESLSDVLKRVDHYYKKTIQPEINSGKNILIAAHGNSLRALLVGLNIHTAEEIPTIEIPTGKPFAIEFDKGKIIKQYYLE